MDLTCDPTLRREFAFKDSVICVQTEQKATMCLMICLPLDSLPNLIALEKVRFKTLHIMNIRTFNFFFFLLISITLYTQTEVNGIVTDSRTGEPIPGVLIQVAQTFSGTVARQNGQFQFTAPITPPFNLEVSFLGYRSTKIAIDRPEDALGIRIVMEFLPLNMNEVIVTAELREEMVQKVPMSVAVFEQSFLSRSRAINDPGDLVEYVAGFSGKNYSSNGALYSIRGINSTGAGSLSYESSIAIFHDGVYNGRAPTAGRNFFDIDRIEIAKGPQSALVGRHALGGVVSIHSNKPKFYKDLSTQMSIGNWGQKEIQYQFNYPLSNKMAIRFAGLRSFRDGVVKITNLDDTSGKADITGNRFSLLWRPQNGLNIQLQLDHLLTKGGGLPNKSINPLTGGNPDPFNRNIQLDFDPEDRNEYFSAGLHGNWAFNDRLALKSITGYNHNTQDPFNADLDGSPTHIVHMINPNGFSNFIQDLRLSGKSEQLEWFVATSFFYEDVDMIIEGSLNDFIIIPALSGLLGIPPDFCVDNPSCLTDAREISANQANNTSYSLFSNVHYLLGEKLDLSAGIRFSLDEKRLDSGSELGNGAIHAVLGSNIQGPPGFNKSTDNWFGIQPRIALDYDWNEHVMLYGAYSRGFKAGGFNAYTPTRFEKETNDAFEVGIKSSLAHQSIKLNFAAYYMLFKDKQEEFIQNNIIEINNAARVVSRGFEMESSFSFFQNFTFIANAGLNFAEFKEFIIPAPNNPNMLLDFSGNIPRRSPYAQLNVVAQYTVPVKKLGTLIVRADLSHQSKEYFNRDNNQVQQMQGYSLFNAFFGLEKLFKGRIDLALFATNIFNSDYIVDSREDFAGGFVVNPGVPRLYGLRLNLNNVLNW